MVEERRETGDIAPSMNPDERSDLQDYKDKESTNTKLVKIATRNFPAQKN